MNRDKLATIRRIATIARSEFERTDIPQKHLDFCGACAIVSTTLQEIFRKLGITATLVLSIDDDDNEGHCWVEVDEYVIDISATQFGGNRVEVFKFGKNPARIKTNAYSWRDRRENSVALLDLNMDTWYNQSPDFEAKTINKVINRVLRRHSRVLKSRGMVATIDKNSKGTVQPKGARNRSAVQDCTPKKKSK